MHVKPDSSIWQTCSPQFQQALIGLANNKMKGEREKNNKTINFDVKKCDQHCLQRCGNFQNPKSSISLLLLLSRRAELYRKMN